MLVEARMVCLERSSEFILFYKGNMGEYIICVDVDGLVVSTPIIVFPALREESE